MEPAEPVTYLWDDYGRTGIFLEGILLPATCTDAETGELHRIFHARDGRALAAGVSPF